MRTPFAAQLVAVAVTLLVLALVLQSGSLLLLCLLPTALLGLGLATPPATPRFAVVRTLDRDRVAVGQDIHVDVTVRNEGRSLAIAEVVDALPSGLRVTKGTNRVVLAIPEGGDVRLTYAVTSPMKGSFDIGPLRIRSHDPLGFGFEPFSSGESAKVSVAPRFEDIRGARIVPRRTRPQFGQVPARLMGLGTEFFGIREYAQGDETRWVNWKASARFDRLLTNEFEGERTSDAVIILDARLTAEVGPSGASTTEWGVRAALGIASALLTGGNRVGLVVQRTMLDWVYPGFGKKQLYRILEALIRARPGGAWGLEHVAWILARFFPRNAVIIVISPLVDAQSVGAVAALVARGLDVVVVSPSPVEIEWRMHRRREAYRDAYRVLRMERSNAIAALRHHALIVDWDPEVPLAAALKGVERFPRQR